MKLLKFSLDCRSSRVTIFSMNLVIHIDRSHRSVDPVWSQLDGGVKHYLQCFHAISSSPFRYSLMIWFFISNDTSLSETPVGGSVYGPQRLMIGNKNDDDKVWGGGGTRHLGWNKTLFSWTVMRCLWLWNTCAHCMGEWATREGEKSVNSCFVATNTMLSVIW